MDNYVVSDTSLGSVANKIREKGGTSAPLEYPQGFIDAIDAISGGGDEPIPDDGKTRIWIHIAEGTPDNRLTFYLRFTASEADNTTVDWGDGTVETKGSTTATNYSHKYSQGGDYIIAMTVNSGTIRFVGTSGNNGYSIYGIRTTNNYHNRFRIRKIVIGDSVISIENYAFYQCSALTSITIPDSVTSIATHAFYQCFALTSIAIPDSVTSIATYAFFQCFALTSIAIPDSVTSIGASAFYQCFALTSIAIPDSVTSIGTSAFNECYSMSEYHFKPTTPPTVASSNAFNAIPSGCIIYVPQGSLSAYQSATNYSNVASRMQEEPT